MNNQSEQRIMVYCDFSQSMNIGIVHGARMADIFKKELCLFHALGKKDRNEKLAVQKSLTMIIRKLKKDLPGMTISSLTLKGELEDTIERVAEQYDAILLVLTDEKLKHKIKALQSSPIPFLFVKADTAEYLQYNQVLLPVDFRKVMKDTSLWASYFGRFNKSSVVVLGANDKDSDNQKKTKKNLKFIEKLLYKLHLDVTFEQANNGSFRLPWEALNKSVQNHSNLLIIPSSKNISLIDLMIGLPETKIIKKSGDLPVLCINPKKDMYILCD
ncbi:hypothetical protein ACUNWD_18920 [Sunxiuqinia sp. A32]|uniref:hypothetical protein n=1 Tax=Sunxiuqinia sp. A32 TaxID=3461496 RepID=UPI0040462A73